MHICGRRQCCQLLGSTDCGMGGDGGGVEVWRGFDPDRTKEIFRMQTITYGRHEWRGVAVQYAHDPATPPCFPALPSAAAPTPNQQQSSVADNRTPGSDWFPSNILITQRHSSSFFFCLLKHCTTQQYSAALLFNTTPFHFCCLSLQWKLDITLA